MNENLLQEILAELLKDSIIKFKDEVILSDNEKVKEELTEKLMRYAGYLYEIEKNRGVRKWRTTKIKG